MEIDIGQLVLVDVFALVLLRPTPVVVGQELPWLMLHAGENKDVEIDV